MNNGKTRYVAAYDAEQPEDCLAACRQIRTVHERFGFPATFFIVGKRLEEEGKEYRALLGDDAPFEIASHTYSHRMLRDHPSCGPKVPAADRIHEITRGKELVEKTFKRPCVDLRQGCGFADGLKGDPWLVRQVAEAGFGYISSLLWGPETTVPALLEPPFPYVDDGCPQLWELPAHGWHENLLKSHTITDRPQRILAWPSPFPEAVVLSPIGTPEEEFALNRIVIDRAVESRIPYVSLIWHPWPLHRFDPEMRMLEMAFSYVRDHGLEPTTFEAEWRRAAAGVSTSGQEGTGPKR